VEGSFIQDGTRDAWDEQKSAISISFREGKYVCNVAARGSFPACERENCMLATLTSIYLYRRNVKQL
jgi:hypothetical protein